MSLAIKSKTFAVKTQGNFCNSTFACVISYYVTVAEKNNLFYLGQLFQGQVKSPLKFTFE